MRFSCEKALLQSAIMTAARAVSPKSTIPALEGLLLEAAQDGTITLTGYDQETGIRSTVSADVVAPGSLVLPARLFGEIVRKLPDDTVLFQEEQRKIHISCGMSEFDLMGIDPEDFPELPSVETEHALALPEQVLRSMIGQTLFAVSEDESRPIHMGALFVVDDEGLTMVAVDGFRLALRREPLLEHNGTFEFVVPGASLSEVEDLPGHRRPGPDPPGRAARPLPDRPDDPDRPTAGGLLPRLAAGDPPQQSHPLHRRDPRPALVHRARLPAGQR